MKGINMKKYSYTATRSFTQSYMITVEAKNEEEAWSKAYDLKYNNNHEWTEVGDLEADDKLIDIERCAVEDDVKAKEYHERHA
jgi:hypothetical protein